MTGWQNQLNGHEFEQALRDDEGPGRQACCSSMKSQSDTNEPLNNNNERRVTLSTISPIFPTSEQMNSDWF